MDAVSVTSGTQPNANAYALLVKSSVLLLIELMFKNVNANALHLLEAVQWVDLGINRGVPAFHVLDLPVLLVHGTLSSADANALQP